MKRMSQNFPNGGAMDTHFANMRSLIQVSAAAVCGGWAVLGLLASQREARGQVGPEMPFMYKLLFHIFIYQGAGLEFAAILPPLLDCWDIGMRHQP